MYGPLALLTETGLPAARFGPPAARALIAGPRTSRPTTSKAAISRGWTGLLLIAILCLSAGLRCVRGPVRQAGCRPVTSTFLVFGKTIGERRFKVHTVSQDSCRQPAKSCEARSASLQ